MRVDFHIHTSFSRDSSIVPEELIEKALDENIQCLAICDHKTINGALLTMRLAFSKPILIIPGIEISTKAGDVLALGIKRKISDGLSFEKTISEIKKQNAFVIIPHPFGKPTPFKSSLNHPEIHAIEGINGATLKILNKKVFKISHKLNKPLIANSDAHSIEEFGNVFFEIPDGAQNQNDVFKAIVENKITIPEEISSLKDSIKINNVFKRLYCKHFT